MVVKLSRRQQGGQGVGRLGVVLVVEGSKNQSAWDLRTSESVSHLRYFCFFFGVFSRLLSSSIVFFRLSFFIVYSVLRMEYWLKDGPKPELSCSPLFWSHWILEEEFRNCKPRREFNHCRGWHPIDWARKCPNSSFFAEEQARGINHELIGRNIDSKKKRDVYSLTTIVVLYSVANRSICPKSLDCSVRTVKYESGAVFVMISFGSPHEVQFSNLQLNDDMLAKWPRPPLCGFGHVLAMKTIDFNFSPL